VDDAESIRSIQRALDLGVTFFDTAAAYGTGHSERILGKALGTRRSSVVIATKFGQVFDEATRQVIAYDTRPERVREECEASLRRLDTDVIDLYQLHVVRDVDDQRAVEVREALEELVTAGKIRYYGWSTDSADQARIFAMGAHCTAIQQQFSIFDGDSETLALCEEYNLASINRGPLSMGLLTGKFTHETEFPGDDVRTRRPALQEERSSRIEMLERIRSVLIQDGRTLAQGALGWLWARSHATIPIPGFKNIQQVEENAGALAFGPLTKAQMEEITALLA
jgi:aryl-alcohol dehydrogenase-like predicted oxidoreductase